MFIFSARNDRERECPQLLNLYNLFNFTIASEIAFPYAATSTRNPDVWIRFQRFDYNPSLVGERGGPGLWGRATADTFDLRANGIARYQVRNGCEILIDPFAGADEQAIRGPLNGIVLAALLQQRGFLVLHGGVVDFEGQGMALLGDSGMGKSSLVSFLQRQGAAAFSDELCVVHPDELGRMCVWPVSQAIALCEDAVLRQGIDRHNAQPIRDKLRIFADHYAEKPIPLTRLTALRKSPAGLYWQMPKDNEKLAVLLRNTYLRSFLNDIGTEKRMHHLQHCINLVRQAEFRIVYRPFEPVDEADFVRQIKLSFEGASQ